MKEIGRIALFFDGRPGHEKQTLGLVEQLKKKIAFETVSFRVKKATLFESGKSLLAYYTFGSKAQHDLRDCSIAIGTGTHTHLPMLLAKKHSPLYVVTCMTPARYLVNDFDLIFAPHHDGMAKYSNVFETIGPPNTNCNNAAHEKGRTLILLGGVDTKSHVWNEVSLLYSLNQIISAQNQTSYILSSSPRTPEATETAVRELAEEHPHVSFYPFSETASGWIEAEYVRAEEVWVTGDSISMVYEALSSGCKVGIIPVQWKAKSYKFMQSEKYLYKNGYVLSLEDYLAGIRWSDHNKPLNEAERCANELLRRWK